MGRVPGPPARPREEVLLVLGVRVGLGIALNYAGFDAIKLLFTSAVINGVLAPPLILIVLLLTSDRAVMGAAAIHGRWRSLDGPRSASWRRPPSACSSLLDAHAGWCRFWSSSGRAPLWRPAPRVTPRC